MVPMVVKRKGPQPTPAAKKNAWVSPSTMVEHRVTAGRGRRRGRRRRRAARARVVDDSLLETRATMDTSTVGKRRMRARENGCEGTNARVLVHACWAHQRERGLGLTDARTRVCRRHVRRRTRTAVQQQPGPTAANTECKKASFLACSRQGGQNKRTPLALSRTEHGDAGQRHTQRVHCLAGPAARSPARAFVRSLAGLPLVTCAGRGTRRLVLRETLSEAAQVRKCHTHVIIGGARQCCARRARN